MYNPSLNYELNDKIRELADMGFLTITTIARKNRQSLPVYQIKITITNEDYIDYPNLKEDIQYIEKTVKRQANNVFFYTDK